MDCIELSDLEEGEILEYESLSPSDTKSDDNEIKNRSFDLLQKENKNGHFRIKERNDSNLYLNKERKKDYLHKTLKNKLKSNEKPELTKSNINMVDLESISSEEECKSDEEKYFSKENKYYKSDSKEKKIRRKHSPHFYGTVEDIMSEIGETICRKSRCNYKKRKSKGSQCSLYKNSDNSYDLWRHKIFSSHLKHKKHKRKVSFNDSDSELKKQKRRRRKEKGEVHCEEDEKQTKKRQVKDFDEMRRRLLEKLQKKKAEENFTKKENDESTLKVENSEIQEVDMLIDCTNYVDNPSDLMPEKSANEEWTTNEKNGEDELDLIKLRLIALASNKKRKDVENILKDEKLEDVSGRKKFSDNNKVDMDFDRNELLLRAEALKSALLKKHQKRLNKTKVIKLNEIKNLDGNNVVNFSPPSVEENMKHVNLGKNIRNLDPDAFKENVESKSENEMRGNCSDVPLAHALDLKMKISEMSKSAVISNASPKKTLSKTRNKRKKRKSGSFAAVDLKEKSEKSAALEEDDRTLRSQLLSDLMKKKSLKDLEKKSVLMDSIQTSANKHPFSIMNCTTSRENTKPLSIAKKNALKKVNSAPKKTKPRITPPIPKPEIQRIIVHLGSEESSDEDEISSQAVQGLSTEKNQSSLPLEQEKKSKDNDFKSAEVSKNENEVIHAAYERSVELLLNQARKKIEGKNRTAKENTLATPEAVYKHLPLSQRLEYMKLKQKIAEREKLRNQRKEFSSNSVFSSMGPHLLEITPNEKEYVESVSQKLGNCTKKDEQKLANLPSNVSPVDNISCHSSKSEVVSRLPSNSKIVCGLINPNELKTKESSHYLLNKKIENNFPGVCEKDIKECATQSDQKEKVAVSSQRNTLLLPSSQALLTKLKLLLKKIKIEKMIEENYEKEISKLKNQLSLFEKKKSEQRFKIKKLGEESVKTYKAIQRITAKFSEKSMPKEDLSDGKSEHEKKVNEKVMEEKKEEKGLVVPEEPDKEINKGKLDNELNNDEKISETVTSGSPPSVCLQEYKSPLQVFNKVSDCSEKVDPNVMMCQFDLLGICKDEECVYQHLRAS